ncbi:hypothetical protein LCGC14_1305140 [marine sediment metagenome]|uniref:Uncharacterized protein n=1 Tax=marine sediment metagenome TaxID=412755 RepID=A0A0F9L8X1_9ZZZZ
MCNEKTIPVSCRTNLDGYKREQWPVEMIVRPLVGDPVKSLSGRTLKIISVTHATRKGRAVSSVDNILHPVLEIELNK